jgi:cell division protein FtsQ
LQPIAEDRGLFGNRGGKGHLGLKSGTRFSWFTAGQAQADRASRAGFVLSMMFLASAAIYALSLPGAAMPVISQVVAIADRAAFDAGFRLEDLAVSGSQNTPRALLLDALGLPYASSSILYNTSEAHDRLLELGWIEAAEVRRILPSRLEVVLSERTPIARWAGAENNVQAIDREGRFLGSDNEGRFGTLLLFSGDGAPAQAAAFVDGLSDHEALKRHIERAELIAERFWMVKLDTGFSVKLPHKVNAVVLERLESLLANSRIAEMALETIDLRLSNRTILQLRDATTANRDRAIASLTSAQPQAWPAPRKGKAL